MKKLLLFASLLILVSCESEWQMKTYYTKVLYYNCKGNGRIEKGENIWIFTGTKKEAEAKIKTTSTYEHEPPYCIQSTITTTMIGKK
jgi:hypothetical protein